MTTTENAPATVDADIADVTETDGVVDLGASAEAAPEGASLYERLGGIYGIAGAVDVLADRLYDNVSANQNENVSAFHQMQGRAGFKFLVTAWSVEQTGGPKCYPGRDMKESHAHLHVSNHEFNIVAGEIAATLYHVGVPEQEHKEFMAIIEKYRSMVLDPAQG